MSAMDDKQLADLFRSAADDAGAAAPPPTFDHDDVLAGSQRLARRQRATVAALVAGVVLVGFGAVFSGVLRGPSQTSALAERPPAAAPAGAVAGDAGGSAAVAPGFAPGAPGFAPGAPMPGATVPGVPVPGGPVPGVAPGVPGVAPELAPRMAPAPYAAKSAPRADSLNAAPEPGGVPFAADSAGPSARGKMVAGGCAGPDSHVFTQLTVVLPEAHTALPSAVPGGCAPGGAGVAIEVNDAGASGTLVAVLTPPTVNPAMPPDSAAQASAIARTPSGGVLRLTAVGARSGAIPYRARLAQLAAALAAHL